MEATNLKEQDILALGWERIGENEYRLEHIDEDKEFSLEHAAGDRWRIELDRYDGNPLMMWFWIMSSDDLRTLMRLIGMTSKKTYTDEKASS